MGHSYLMISWTAAFADVIIHVHYELIVDVGSFYSSSFQSDRNEQIRNHTFLIHHYIVWNHSYNIGFYQHSFMFQTIRLITISNKLLKNSMLISILFLVII